MDQEAFRSLLATPSSQSATSKSRFGQQNPKRVLPCVTSLSSLSLDTFTPLLAHSTAKDGASTDFKPRVKKDYKPKKAPDGSVYRDRAAERRQGKEGDFAQAEKLLEVRFLFPHFSCFPALTPSRAPTTPLLPSLTRRRFLSDLRPRQDFKARATNEDVDKDTLEDQMKYLVRPSLSPLLPPPSVYPSPVHTDLPSPSPFYREETPSTRSSSKVSTSPFSSATSTSKPALPTQNSTTSKTSSIRLLRHRRRHLCLRRRLLLQLRR